MTASPPPIPSHPSYAGSSVALLASLCAAGLATGHPVQLSVVGIAGAGAFALMSSHLVRRRGQRVAGYALLLAGSLVLCLALGLGAVFPAPPVERGALVSVVLGPVALALGLYPLRAAWGRHFAGLGLAFLTTGIVVRGWLEQLGELRLLVAVMTAILAWDAAEHAISVGDDVGRGARTAAVSLTHAAGSLGVGLVAVLVATGIYGATPSAVPVGSIVLLLGAVLLSLLALYLGHLE